LHTPSFLENSTGKGIVIFIHGFMGSPRQFDKLAECVYRAGFSAASVLLPGHGSTAKEFSSGTMESWLNHVYAETERFLWHDKIYLVGHSMGGLLAINTAVKYGERVSGIFLIACPFKFRTFSKQTISVRLKQAFCNKRHPMKAAYLTSSSIQLRPSIIWRIVKPTSELKKLMQITKDKLHDIRVPVTAVYSAYDELVSVDSLEILKTGLTQTTFESLILSDSLHAYYPAHEQAAIEKQLVALCETGGVDYESGST